MIVGALNLPTNIATLTSHEATPYQASYTLHVILARCESTCISFSKFLSFGNISIKSQGRYC